jgi:cytochrome c oxidase assembly factor CtaG
MTAGFLGEWELDGAIGLAFSLLTVAVGIVYLAAAKIGHRRDRRSRRWPPGRTACFLGGIVVLLIALDSGIGASADEHLSAHMVERMLIWLAVAPLLVAAAPIRLAFFALGTTGRRRLARALHSDPVRTLTGPVPSTLLFSTVVVVGHIPAVYDLTLENGLVHVAEHAAYLVTAILIWAPLIRADPSPTSSASAAAAGASPPAWCRWRRSRSGSWRPARRSTPPTKRPSARPPPSTTSASPA